MMFGSGLAYSVLRLWHSMPTIHAVPKCGSGGSGGAMQAPLVNVAACHDIDV